jgi:hypothetical protein
MSGSSLENLSLRLKLEGSVLSRRPPVDVSVRVWMGAAAIPPRRAAMMMRAHDPIVTTGSNECGAGLRMGWDRPVLRRKYNDLDRWVCEIRYMWR